MIGPRIFDHDQPLRLRAAIAGKAGKYGDLGKPLVVVTNSTQMQTADDLMTALLGDKLWQLNLETKEFTERRKPNGVFTDAGAGRNNDLSAVLHGHFGAAGFADAQLVIVQHPFAHYPLSQGVFPFAEERYFDVVGAGDMVTKSPTMTVREFFGLDEGWPFFEDDPSTLEDSP